MRNIAFIGCALLLAAHAGGAEIYKWVDDNGVIHYSDEPHPGAEKLELPDGPPAPAVSPGATQRTLPSNRERADEEAPPAAYASFTVASPAPEETLWNIGGTLTVRLDLQPALKPGHQVRVYYDGEPQMVASLQFELNEVYRGTHNLQAEVLNDSGQLMIRSQPIRFYVHQTSILN